MNTAWLFPGHGTQYVGMGSALLRSTSLGLASFDRAESISGLPLLDYCQRGPLTDLTCPAVLEPVLAALSIGYVDSLREEGLEPDSVAGYSAGEVGAMYAARVFDADTCLRIACIRGAILKKAAAHYPGGMMSVSGLFIEHAHACIEHACNEGAIEVAAYNSPQHFTLSGESPALTAAARYVGQTRATVGHVYAEGPWHTRLLNSARDELRAVLSEFTFSQALVPVWTSAAGSCTQDPEHLRSALCDSVCSTVRWTAIVEGLLKRCHHFLEVGSGQMLWGLLGQYGLPPGIQRRFLERSGTKRLNLSRLASSLFISERK